MDGDSPDVVGVGLEGSDLLGGVVVVDAQLEIIGAADDPVLSGNEATGTNRDVGQLKSLDDLLGLIAPDVDMACSGGSCQWEEPSEGVYGNEAGSTYRCRGW